MFRSLLPGLYSVRQLLLWLVLACLLPGLLVAAVLMGYQHSQSRHELEQQTIFTARALVQSVDNHLFKMQSTAQALANSESLKQGNLAAFHSEASQTMRQVGLGSNMVLRDRAGFQILNTALEFGRTPNVPPALLQVQGVFESARPTISNLFIGPVRKRPLMSVDVPVMLNGEVVYALGIGMLPEQFTNLLAAQKLPAEWFTGVLDQKGVYVGRTRQPERFVGQPGSASLLQQLDRQREGLGNTVTPEGTEVVTFHSRSPVTGWTVTIGVPREAFRQGLYDTSLLWAGSVSVLFTACALFAWLISSRIAAAFQALSAQAAGLVGEPPAANSAPPRVKEALEVTRALERAAVLLDERELTLKESEARFKAVADNMAQLAWMSDAEGTVLWFNQRWYEFAGHKYDGSHSVGWLGCVRADHQARVRAEFEAQIAAGLPWEDTFPLRGEGKAARWFLSRALPLRDAAGRITSWFGTHTDVTPQLEAQQALQEADVRKDEFIAVLAHELRNPLAPVRTAVEILQRSGPHEPRLARACQVIERQVTHMSRLIDDLLDVARIASGNLDLQRQTCDLALIARQTAEDYQLSLETSGLVFSMHAPAQPVWVFGDEVRLAQMIGNLLNNASRFTEPDGHVTVDVAVQVETDLRPAQAVVKVVDTGVGIPVELMQRLFLPFSQAAQDLARSKGGLGLGLALTKGLVELHGGSLQVESGGAGQGTTVTLTLPLASAATSAMAAPALLPAPATVAPPPRRWRILIIEDNQDAARTLTELLRLTGHEVELAFDGESGLALAQHFKPEVVISDIGLPGLDGYAVARQMRRNPALKGVYLVALSGYTDEQARSRGAEAGFDRYLFKPVGLNELEELLEDLDATESGSA